MLQHNFLTYGGRARLVASVSGLIAVASINLFAGCIGITAAAAIHCSSFFILPSLSRLRGRPLLIHAASTAVAVAALLMCWPVVSNDHYARTVLNVIFYDQHFYRCVLTEKLRVASFFSVSAAILLVLIAASMFPSARKQWHLHLIGWGFTGLLLLLLAAPAPLGLDDVIPAPQVVFLLSVVFALAIGICAGIMLDAAGNALHSVVVSLPARQWMRSISGSVMIAAAILLFHGAPASAIQTAEPDGFVRNLYLIERTFIPYQWTIVAHRGILLAGMNRGRFLDYDYFTASYDPVTYRHGTKGAIPTALVFIFIEKNKDVTEISSELIPVNRNAMARTREWCETYRKTHTNMTIFFSDDTIIIYELRDPHVPSLRV